MRRYLVAALAALSLLAFGGAAEAASLRVCAPSSAGAALGPAQVVAPTSGNLYSINGRGCVLIPATDLADFQSKGYVVDAGLTSMVVVSGVLTSTTSVQVATLPATAYISNILVQNTTTNAVTGGIDIGKTTGAADIVSAKVCAASCLTSVLDSAVLLRVFSTTAVQPIWVTGHTDGNSANLTLTIIYGYF